MYVRIYEARLEPDNFSSFRGIAASFFHILAAAIWLIDLFYCYENGVEDESFLLISSSLSENDRQMFLGLPKLSPKLSGHFSKMEKKCNK